MISSIVGRELEERFQSLLKTQFRVREDGGLVLTIFFTLANTGGTRPTLPCQFVSLNCITFPCAAKVAELLQSAKTLDDAALHDSVKNLPVWELEGSTVRVKNMLNNIGVCALWELVHFDMEKCKKYRGGFFASKYRMSELLYAIKEAIDLLPRLAKT